MTRAVVGLLGGLAATFAFLVGAVSLTRIAGDYLGFPPGLEWTFTGAVDTAGIAGGIMWTAFAGTVRSIGRAMNIVCTMVSGVGVGLDHATHAGRALTGSGTNSDLWIPAEAWPFVAFVAGVFMPALATWILHALSVIADGRQVHTATPQDRHAATSGAATSGDRHAATHVIVATGSAGPPRADRHTAATPTATPVDRHTATPREVQPARTATRDRHTATRQVSAAALPAATQATARVGLPGPRPGWMSEPLLSAVVAAARQARAEGKPYGRRRLVADHDLTDHRAKAVIEFIEKHDLLRVSA